MESEVGIEPTMTGFAGRRFAVLATRSLVRVEGFQPPSTPS